MSDPSSAPRDLFGGAITARVPRSFLDASEFRPVPDTQEVFIDDASGATVIIELLERVEDVPDSEALNFHFEEVARQNRATEAHVVQMSDAATGELATGGAQSLRFYSQALLGRQKVAKFQEQGKENDVAVYMGLKRLADPVATDMLVTVSYAFNVAEESSDACVDRSRQLSPDEVQQLGDMVFHSLTVVDYGLFGDDGTGGNGAAEGDN